MRRTIGALQRIDRRIESNSRREPLHLAIRAEDTHRRRLHLHVAQTLETVYSSPRSNTIILESLPQFPDGRLRLEDVAWIIVRHRELDCAPVVAPQETDLAALLSIRQQQPGLGGRFLQLAHRLHGLRQFCLGIHRVDDLHNIGAAFRLPLEMFEDLRHLQILVHMRRDNHLCPQSTQLLRHLPLAFNRRRVARQFARRCIVEVRRHVDDRRPGPCGRLQNLHPRRIVPLQDGIPFVEAEVDRMPGGVLHQPAATRFGANVRLQSAQIKAHAISALGKSLRHQLLRRVERLRHHDVIDLRPIGRTQ